jgi:type IV pilus assembly protein PilM
MLQERFNGLLRFLTPRPKPLLGLDISSSAVKMVEISQTGGGFQVEHYATEPLPREAVVEGNLADLEAVSDAVKRAWRRMGTRTRGAAMALPASAVITRKVVMPAAKNEDELEIQVESEANQYIPFTLDEVNLDFQIVGPVTDGAEGEIEVLIAASRKDRVEDRVAAAQAAGLRVHVMDVDAYANLAAVELIQRRLPGGGRKQLLSLVDLGATTMRVTMFHEGAQVYLREQPVGGNALTSEIARHFSISLDEAEAAKRQGNLPESYLPEILQPFRENIALEIARAHQFFFTSTPYSHVDHIILSGGCASLPGLEEAVSTRTQVNTFIANPFARMTVAPGIKARQLAADAPALLTACGLALRSFDE